MEKGKSILEVAKQILDLNPQALLTGSLMLKIRGIDLGREPHDIDILIRDFAPNIIFPKDSNVKEIGVASNGEGAKYNVDGFIVDVMSSGEAPSVYKGWRLGSVEELMNAKYIYSTQKNDSAKKHYDDLIKMHYDFPKKESTDLPF